MPTDQLEPDDVMLVFCAQTGFEKPRHPSSIVVAQCRAFSKLYRRWELILVIKWLQAQIREGESTGRGALTRLSLQFRNFFKAEPSDDPAVMAFDTFEDRLQLARVWAKRAQPSLLPSTPKPKTFEAPKQVSEAEREEMARRYLEQSLQ